MTITEEKKLPYVLCTVNRQLFAVSCAHVQEILMLPRVEAVSGVPPHIRGMVNIRGNVIQVVDLRVRLGMISARQEVEDLIDLMEKREQDHRNWLTELLASVREKREFKLTTNPHLCAFGKWYDSFQTDDRLLAVQMRKFDEPHKRIHAVAVTVLEHVAKGEEAEALKLIDWTRENTLTELVNLFETTRQLIREQHRDIGVVISDEGRTTMMCVDRIESIEFLEPHPTGTHVVASFASDVSGVALRKGHTTPVLLLDPAKLFN